MESMQYFSATKITLINYLMPYIQLIAFQKYL